MEDEFQRLKSCGQRMEILPMKAVATRKPPNRRKGRVVVCGNFSTQAGAEDISVGGVCSTAIRATVHLATNRSWGLGTIDVAGAFLQAPRRAQDRITIVEPPVLLQQMGITQPGERWKVACALYGFTESPADWAHHRDQGMRRMMWQCGEEKLRMEETPEKHVWKIVNSDGATKGVVLVYVDDFLAAGESHVLSSFFGTIKEKWTCSEEELVEEDRVTRFCGKEKKAAVFGLDKQAILMTC